MGEVTYDVRVSVPGVKGEALRDFNRLWGFDDGHCNEVGDDGQITAKPGAEDGTPFDAAQRRLHSHTEITIRVTVQKDGRMSFEVKT